MIRNVPYALQVLGSISLPLLLAAVRSKTPKSEESTTIGAMLDRTVQLTHEMEKKLGLAPEASGFVEGKLMLAGLASKIVAAWYESEGEVLSEAEFTKILIGFELILSKAENFNFQSQTQFHSESYEPLLNTVATGLNKPQSEHISYIQALAPILAPISEFSFGINDKKLIQSVSDTLFSRSQTLTSRLMGNFPDPDRESFARLGILKVLGQVYAQVHAEQTKNIMAMDERIRQQNTSQITIDMVWRAFERQCALMEALLEGLVPAEQESLPDTLTDLDLDEILVQPAPVAATLQPSPLSFYKKTKKT